MRSNKNKSPLLVAYRAAVTISAAEGVALDEGYSCSAGWPVGDTSAAKEAWLRFGAALDAAPWGVHGAFYVTRSSGWCSGVDAATLWVNRRRLVTVEESRRCPGDLRVTVHPHGKDAVRLDREARKAERASRREAHAHEARVRASLEAAFAEAPRAALRAFVERGYVPHALAQVCERHGFLLREGQEGGSAAYIDAAGEWRRMGAARAASRVLSAEARMPEPRYAEMPAVWRAGLADHFA